MSKPINNLFSLPNVHSDSFFSDSEDEGIDEAVSSFNDGLEDLEEFLSPSMDRQLAQIDDRVKSSAKRGRSSNSTSTTTGAETPSPIKRKRVTKMIDALQARDPHSDLSPYSKKKVDKGIRAVETLPDSPKKKQRSVSACLTFASTFHSTTPEENRVEFHLKAHEIIENCPSLKGVIGSTIKIYRNSTHKDTSSPPPTEIINIKHIVEADKRGFHLCLPNDPMQKKLVNKVYSHNEVYHASFRAGPSHQLKHSTFFPLNSVDELVQVIENAQLMAIEEQRHLYSVPGKDYLIEMYRDDATIKSAFPIFYFNKWDACKSGHSIVRGQAMIFPDDLLEKAKQAVSNFIETPGTSNPIRYQIKELGGKNGSVIIDLAPSYPSLGVSQGIFIEFPEQLFETELKEIENIDS